MKEQIFMYKVNDVVLYSTHGICRIDQITEKTVGDELKKFYVMHPLQNPKLTISIPVLNNEDKFKELLNVSEASLILQQFSQNHDMLVDKNYYRSDDYQKLLLSGDRTQMMKTIQSILFLKSQYDQENKKMPISYVKVLDFLQKQLYTEISYALHISTDQVHQMVEDNLAICLSK